MPTHPNPNIVDADTLTGDLRPVRRAALALGSNLGDRPDLLQVLLDALTDSPEIHPVAVSAVYETERGRCPTSSRRSSMRSWSSAAPHAPDGAVQGAGTPSAVLREVPKRAPTLDVDVLAVGQGAGRRRLLKVPPHLRARGAGTRAVLGSIPTSRPRLRDVELPISVTALSTVAHLTHPRVGDAVLDTTGLELQAPCVPRVGTTRLAGSSGAPVSWSIGRVISAIPTHCHRCRGSCRCSWSSLPSSCSSAPDSPRVDRGRRDSRMDALRAARLLALGKGRGGLRGAGGRRDVGLGVLAFDSIAVPAGRNRVVMSALVAVAAVVVSIAGLRLEGVHGSPGRRRAGRRRRSARLSRSSDQAHGGVCCTSATVCAATVCAMSRVRHRRRLYVHRFVAWFAPVLAVGLSGAAFVLDGAWMSAAAAVGRCSRCCWGRWSCGSTGDGRSSSPPCGPARRPRTQPSTSGTRRSITCSPHIWSDSSTRPLTGSACSAAGSTRWRPRSPICGRRGRPRRHRATAHPDSRRGRMST